MSIPSSAVFLVGAAFASDLFPSLGPSISTVELIVTVALVVILFDGGAAIGWRRFRAAAVPVVSLGVPGTFATAGLIAVFAHAVFGLGWLTAGLLGAAIAPTDPAVVFSVLGGREIRGRARTILEGESGANDPVGIALMLGLIALATHADASFWIVVRVLVEQVAIGLLAGIAGGLLERRLLRVGWLRTLALVAVVYVAADLAHGSGFLAVFVMGLVVGDIEAPSQTLQDRVASVAEIVAFVALGLTVHISGIGAGRWAEGLALAGFVALVARPLVAGALLAPVRLGHGERLFVIWGGLKGAVPILLAAFAVTHHVRDAARIYETVFVVVLASVVVQGGTIPAAARRLVATPRAERAA
ncbi:MAG: potassium/hydrogen antiporter [Gaiellaceae bacterium]|nr:potassium/hydrogen antiporter [Gaiellaceae bacterium]